MVRIIKRVMFNFEGLKHISTNLNNLRNSSNFKYFQPAAKNRAREIQKAIARAPNSPCFGQIFAHLSLKRVHSHAQTYIKAIWPNAKAIVCSTQQRSRC